MNIFHLTTVSQLVVNQKPVQACFVGTNLSPSEMIAAKRLGVTVERFDPPVEFELIAEGYSHVDQVSSLVILADDAATARSLHDARDELVAQSSEDPNGPWGISFDGTTVARRFRDSGAAVAVVNLHHRRGQAAHVVAVSEESKPVIASPSLKSNASRVRRSGRGTPRISR